ncbi:AT hook domain-containing protein [Drepanopeziza brunnea f. sp. 'multigermtubi' MB_m1]|uniref:AT hook domain-containing protein n=1 Tax=Marssonina brunnea f. sp. multigermtubi (strain MB_m1) TaxID=1072389 RepID=K1WRI3_MARBU|nr:AT hook domain-containing protein [Drepanopeziza brunnea f. sp. 'multigermtubi' MB_m1]EKD20270.1 AT hook domain-containing protein [Drepanopeziza brunnea f. sp. 'multigermtubi' MB_m1]
MALAMALAPTPGIFSSLLSCSLQTPFDALASGLYLSGTSTYRSTTYPAWPIEYLYGTMNTQPFSEEEKRFVLAEAIRTSTIPLDRLFHFLNDGRIHIAWDEMLLPRGRNLKQCKDAFEALRPSPPTQMYQFQAHSQSLPALSPIIASAGIKRKSPGQLELFSPASDPKRRQSNDPVPTARDIRPKPPPSNGSPLTMGSFHPSEPKKRGRPSKKDVERKQAEAIARGDIIPPATTTPLLGYASHNNEAGTSNYAPILPTPPSMTPAHVYGPTQSTPMRKGSPESAAEVPGKRKQAKATPKALKPVGRASGVVCHAFHRTTRPWPHIRSSSGGFYRTEQQPFHPESRGSTTVNDPATTTAPGMRHPPNPLALPGLASGISHTLPSAPPSPSSPSSLSPFLLPQYYKTPTSSTSSTPHPHPSPVQSSPVQSSPVPESRPASPSESNG